MFPQPSTGFAPCTLEPYVSPQPSWGPSSTLTSTPKRKKGFKKPCADDPGYVPRPRNPFLIFRCDFVRRYRYQGPRRKHRPKPFPKAPTLSKRASIAWHGLPENAKTYFKQAAEEERKEHARLHPYYRFRPCSRGGKKGGIKSSSLKPAPLPQPAELVLGPGPAAQEVPEMMAVEESRPVEFFSPEVVASHSEVSSFSVPLVQVEDAICDNEVPSFSAPFVQVEGAIRDIDSYPALLNLSDSPGFAQVPCFQADGAIGSHPMPSGFYNTSAYSQYQVDSHPNLYNTSGGLQVSFIQPEGAMYHVDSYPDSFDTIDVGLVVNYLAPAGCPEPPYVYQ